MVFSQAIGSLNAVATNLDVTGNNIANSATYGFKFGTASFADMFAGPKIGLGIKIADIAQDFTNDITTSTGRELGIAISQNGFFRMVDSNGSVFYSCNGQFKLDENRNIVDMQGLQLTGYPATGTPPTVQQGADSAPVTIPNTLMTAESTITTSIQVNLNSTDKVPTKTPSNPSGADSYNKKGSVTVFDSQDSARDISVFYVKSKKSNTWEIFTQDISTGDAEKSAGFMRFDNNGLFLGTSATVAEVPPTAPAIWPKDIKITTGPISDVVPTNFSLSFLNSMQQNTSANDIVTTNRNGYKPGGLVSYRINSDDMVVGNYSNGQQQVLRQIVLVNFANNEGLASQGDNAWATTQSSNMALLDTAGEGNFGKLTNGVLEVSDVGSNEELVNMIVTQHSYQSNARTIKTQDQILNTLVDLR